MHSSIAHSDYADHTLAPTDEDNQDNIEKLSKELALKSMKYSSLYNEELLLKLEEFWCNILPELMRKESSMRIKLMNEIYDYLKMMVHTLNEAIKDPDGFVFRKRNIVMTIDDLKQYISTHLNFELQQVLNLLNPIESQIDKILRNVDNIFDNAIAILTKNQLHVNLDEQKLPTEANAITTLIAALNAFKRELKYEYLSKFQEKSIALSVENLADKLMDPHTKPDAKNKAITDLQYSLSEFSNKRRLLFILGTTIVCAAIAVALFFNPLVGFAALPLINKIVLGLGFAIFGYSLAGSATHDLRFARRPGLFFTQPIFGIPDIDPVIKAAKAVAKTPVMKS